MNLKRFAVGILLAVTLFSLPAFSYEQGDVSITGGGSLRFESDGPEFQLSVGVGYFVVNGLEVSAAVSSIFGADPFVTHTTFGTRYIFYMLRTFKPYVGGFYRHWFLADNFPDIDTVGGRAGLIISPDSSKIKVSAGVVYERVISECSVDCEAIYPELSFSFHF